MQLPQFFLLFLSAVIGGGINSVAGGGSLISFPTLVVLGVDKIIANATNTAALWPGSIGSVWAYRADLAPQRRLLLTLLLPSFVGGLLGALLLTRTPPELFGQVVPVLVLFATLLFAGRDVFDRFARRNANATAALAGRDAASVTRAGRVWGFVFQLLVATYGGYFGAGIGILMLASLSVMGLRDIHKMNALKTALAFVINGVALVFFALNGLINWPLALLMGTGGLLGGYFGARYAKRMNQKYLRIFVVAMGLTAAAYMFAKARGLV